MRVIDYFTDLGFHPDRAQLSGRPVLAVIGVYAAIALGIFLRQVSAFPAVDVRPDQVRPGIAIGAVIIAVAIASPLMRWISKRHKGRPSWEHIAWGLAYGFFSQVLMTKVVAEIPGSLSKGPRMVNSIEFRSQPRRRTEKAAKLLIRGP